MPGTHGTFYPWYPPPRLPLRILRSLHSALLRESKTMALTHSRQSLTGSATSGLDTGDLNIETVVLSDEGAF